MQLQDIIVAITTLLYTLTEFTESQNGLLTETSWE